MIPDTSALQNGSSRPLAADRAAWRDRFAAVRTESLKLAAPLSAEDQQVQSMPDVSPTKWHLAHITWFFETFLLQPRLEGYQTPDEQFAYLFNSYYEQVGDRRAPAPATDATAGPAGAVGADRRPARNRS